MFRILTVLITALCVSTAAFAQSQAINGSIEGTIVDTQAAVLPGVTVTITNLDTGDIARRGHQRKRPLSRAAAPARPYRVDAELQGFKKFEQSGVMLTAGQTAVIDIRSDASAPCRRR